MLHRVTKNLLGGALIVLYLTACCASPVWAQVLNPSFELTPNFLDWTVTGAASIETSAYDPGSPPTNGIKYALLTNDATSGSVSVSTLESALGYASGTLTGLGDGTVKDGSAISQTFHGTAGQTLTFDWDFLTNQLDPTLITHNDDFAFWSISGVPSIIADVFTGNFLSPEGSSQSQDYLDETGFTHSLPVSYTFPTTGMYTLDFGVVNVNAESVASGLLVDNVQIASSVVPPPGTPEPGALALFAGLGVTVAAKMASRRRRRLIG